MEHSLSAGPRRQISSPPRVRGQESGFTPQKISSLHKMLSPTCFGVSPCLPLQHIDSQCQIFILDVFSPLISCETTLSAFAEFSTMHLKFSGSYYTCRFQKDSAFLQELCNSSFTMASPLSRKSLSLGFIESQGVCPRSSLQPCWATRSLFLQETQSHIHLGSICLVLATAVLHQCPSLATTHLCPSVPTQMLWHALEFL